MAEKSTAAKLLVRPGSRVWVSDPGRATIIGPLPDDAGLVGVAASADVVVVFADNAATARARIADHRAALLAARASWIAYPKGGRADINRDSLWPIAAEAGLRPIGQVAIDETWSALRFRALGPGEAPFTGGGS